MAYSIRIKTEAKKLRKKGFSLKEISERLNIAKSTASAWLGYIKLGKRAQERLQKRQIFGQYKAQQTKRNNRKKMLLQYHKKTAKEFSSIKLDKTLYKLLSALLFWCEGAKTQSCVEFINSDPAMIEAFMKLLRSAFDLDESKFRVLMHLHEYHNEQKQKGFWSEITKIHQNQFTKTYHKSHTKKRKRKNYPGCVRISYYDTRIAHQLYAWYNVFAEKLRGVR